MVKVDPKTEDLLEEFKKKRDEKRKKGKDKEDGENNSEDDDGEDSEKRKDQEVKVQLDLIIKEHEGDLNRTTDDGTDDPDKKTSKGKAQEEMPPLNLEGMELEEDIKYLVNREIRSFRDTHLVSCFSFTSLSPFVRQQVDLEQNGKIFLSSFPVGFLRLLSGSKTHLMMIGLIALHSHVLVVIAYNLAFQNLHLSLRKRYLVTFLPFRPMG